MGREWCVWVVYVGREWCVCVCGWCVRDVNGVWVVCVGREWCVSVRVVCVGREWCLFVCLFVCVCVTGLSRSMIIYSTRGHALIQTLSTVLLFALIQSARVEFVQGGVAFAL